jgi:nucleoside-diphosphate-sugar epimerase
MKVLLTGGSGYFGTTLRQRLLQRGHHYVNFDLAADPIDEHEGRMWMGDLAKPSEIGLCFDKRGPFHAIIHAAAKLAHDASRQDLWQSNVVGTQNLLRAAKGRCPKLIYISTNCLWGRPLNRPVREDDLPCPIEPYGVSKLEAEKLVRAEPGLTTVVFRSSTIVSAGRVGLLSILFDFVLENRKIPVVGKDRKPYQFIYGDDYADAVIAALDYPRSDVFHVGSHQPSSLEECYLALIQDVASKSRIYHLPKGPAIAALKLLYLLGLSPLGPYHYGMIAEEFVFDTTRAGRELGWKASKSNVEVLLEAFRYYRVNKTELDRVSRDSRVPAHKRKAKMGIIGLLKWFS